MSDKMLRNIEVGKRYVTTLGYTVECIRIGTNPDDDYPISMKRVINGKLVDGPSVNDLPNAFDWFGQCCPGYPPRLGNLAMHGPYRAKEADE